jgi:hypothetical protein
MGRLSAAVIVVGMTWLALQGAAAAQSCMCADPVLEPALERSGVLSIEGLSIEGLSIDGLSSDQLERLENATAPSLEVALRVYDESDLPWCTNQNDPQCSKLPAGSLPASINLGSGSVAMLTAVPMLPDEESSACVFDERAGLVPRDAARSKLERPPR